jgi:hypothetical protein
MRRAVATEKPALAAAVTWTWLIRRRPVKPACSWLQGQGALRVIGRLGHVRQPTAFQACLTGIVDHVCIVGVDSGGTLALAMATIWRSNLILAFAASGSPPGLVGPGGGSHGGALVEAGDP